MTPKYPQRYNHWTETDERIQVFLWERFGERPDRCSEGPDLDVCGTTIEVKATSKYIKAKASKYSARRKGRFCFHGYEHADYVLFALIDNTELHIRIIKMTTLKREFGKLEGRKINWIRVFPNLNKKGASK